MTTRKETYSCDLYYGSRGEVSVKHVVVEVEATAETDREAVEMNKKASWAQIREAQAEVGGATTANYRCEHLNCNGKQYY